jgi:hypothetical protein
MTSQLLSCKVTRDSTVTWWEPEVWTLGCLLYSHLLCSCKIASTANTVSHDSNDLGVLWELRFSQWWTSSQIWCQASSSGGEGKQSPQTSCSCRSVYTPSHGRTSRHSSPWQPHISYIFLLGCNHCARIKLQYRTETNYWDQYTY